MREKSALKESPSQTAGPYVHIGCVPNFSGISGVYAEDLGAQMLTGPVQGTRITISGSVVDGAGEPLKDALLEVWQADAEGRFPSDPSEALADPHFTGWARFAGDYETGEWSIETIKPGPVMLADGQKMAPHISFWIVARGINIGLQTRMYFPDEDNTADPVMAQIPDPSRVPTLLAQETAPNHYRFDINLQGDQETVFFDL